MDRHRLVYAGLGLALAALIASVIALAPSGERTALPEPLEGVFPLPGDVVVRQTAIEVDLPVGYTLDLVVDGRLVPAVEVAVTPSTGVWRWQPAPGSTTEQWSPGEHTVSIRWERTSGRPDPGEFTWVFRVT
jgi:hypothetical protein